MTGIRLGIEVHDEPVRNAFATLGARLDDLTPAFDEIGKTMVDHTILRFERQVDPEGQPWTPHAPATLMRRALRGGRGGGAAQILIDSARLRNSISHVAGRDRVAVGTNVIYGAVQQLGGQAGRGGATTIPPRPFVGMDESDREDIPGILARYIGESLQ